MRTCWVAHEPWGISAAESQPRVELFRVQGYSEKTLMKDMRYKLGLALATVVHAHAADLAPVDPGGLHEPVPHPAAPEGVRGDAWGFGLLSYGRGGGLGRRSLLRGPSQSRMGAGTC